MPKATKPHTTTADARLTEAIAHANKALAAAGTAAVPAVASAGLPQHDPLVEWAARLAPAIRRMRLAQHQRAVKVAEMERRGFEDWPVFRPNSGGMVPEAIILWDGDVSPIERHFAPSIAAQPDQFLRSNVESVRDLYVNRAREFYAEWSRVRHEIGLDAADDEDSATNAVVANLDEDEFINTKPVTLGGVLAKLRYAREAAWDHANKPVDQAPEVRAIESAIDFLEAVTGTPSQLV